MQDSHQLFAQFKQCYYRLVWERTFEKQSLIGCPDLPFSLYKYR